MTLSEFRERVEAFFGPNLSRATPANVREFVDSMYAELWKGALPRGGPIEISETATSFEEIVKDFFARIFDYPPEQAVIVLWLMALDLCFAAIEQGEEERFAPLFRELSEE